jgi:predicted DsbA family dithiol-disulfide isomerase
MRLENAMSMVKDEFEFEKIIWKPFFLNSTIPKEGYTYEEYFAKKGMIMTEEKIAQFSARMKRKLYLFLAKYCVK